MQDRQIHNCIGIASEAINMLSKKVRGDNVAYKVDIHKAFNTLSWKFLLLVLTCFGFQPSFVSWISTILRCLVEEVLSRGISKFVNDMVSPQGYLTQSHILYVNGIFVLCRADNKSLRNFSIFLKTFGDFLG